jgi:hypothetical protein
MKFSRNLWEPNVPQLRSTFVPCYGCDMRNFVGYNACSFIYQSAERRTPGDNLLGTSLSMWLALEPEI